MSAAPKCANCGDSGRNPGSEYLDCTHCDAAEQHAELGKFLASNYADPDCAWKVHQRAYAMGVAAMRAEVATAKTDSVRLDWLLENAWVSVLDIDTQVKYDSLRAALDAAMKVKP